MIKIIWPLFILGILLSGCSEPTIDATTDESMKISVAKVRQSLPESKKAERKGENNEKSNINTLCIDSYY